MLASVAVSRAEMAIPVCTASLALAATARAAVRPAIVGTAIGIVLTVVLLGKRSLAPVDRLLTFPVGFINLLPPMFGLAVGVYWREKGFALMAYAIALIVLFYAVILQLDDYNRITRNLWLMSFATLIGLYFGVLGRIVAWWNLVTGPVMSAIFGAVGSVSSLGS